MESWGVANSVTAFATIFAGITTLTLGSLHHHPRHWMLVYGAILLTGLPTLWYHGTDEQVIPARIADIGTNLILAWCIAWAALFDFYSRRARIWVAGISGLTIVAYLLWYGIVGPVRSREILLGLGSFGGFTLGELVLIGNSFLGAFLLGLRIREAPVSSHPYYWITMAWFLMGTLAATASNKQIDFGFMAWHALWHIIGGFGFVMLWAYTDERLQDKRVRQPASTSN